LLYTYVELLTLRLSSIIQKRNYLNIRRNKPLNIIHAEGVNFPIIFV